MENGRTRITKGCKQRQACINNMRQVRTMMQDQYKVKNELKVSEYSFKKKWRNKFLFSLLTILTIQKEIYGGIFPPKYFLTFVFEKVFCKFIFYFVFVK